MMKTRRRAAVAAALCILVAACSGRKGAAGLVRSSAIGTYPRESVALLVLEIKKIRALRPDTPWIKDMASLADREGGPLAVITRRLGPDVLEHLDRLSVAVMPQPDHLIGYGILAEGTFDGAKVREALGGSDLLTLVEAGKMDFSVAILKDGSLALGPKRVLLTMRANDAARGRGLDANPVILTPLEKVRQEAQFWGTVDCQNLKALYKDATGPSDLGGMTLNAAPVQSLVTIAFRGMVGETVDIDLFGQADAEKNAKMLADALRGLVALGRVGAGRDQAKEWLEFLDGIRISQSGPNIDLNASIPAKTMETFVAQMMSKTRPAAEATSPAPARGTSPAPEPAASRAAAASQAPPAPAPRATAAPRATVTPRQSPAPSAGSVPPADNSRHTAPEPRGTQTPSDGPP